MDSLATTIQQNCSSTWRRNSVHSSTLAAYILHSLRLPRFSHLHSYGGGAGCPRVPKRATHLRFVVPGVSLYHRQFLRVSLCCAHEALAPSSTRWGHLKGVRSHRNASATHQSGGWESQELRAKWIACISSSLIRLYTNIWFTLTGIFRIESAFNADQSKHIITKPVVGLIVQIKQNITNRRRR